MSRRKVIIDESEEGMDDYNDSYEEEDYKEFVTEEDDEE